ncbi:nucleolar and coiled-body phosphoprotein 1 [Drosophila subobscura]|uniref:nucleolar and coiled-body phosphoprotein 1 n=1 Tax=Drosophila subobscura TaxID=7241 RepID=UPI00155A4B14|nr:nucleolar and coiled-body phosphoprotein 1 [Drosophila subobscura]
MVNWKHFVNCIKKGKNGKTNGGGGKKVEPPKPSKLMNMSDILERVPPNQLPQFQMFKKRNEEYRARVRKYPDAMPKIDWEYYRKNVRPEFVSWVNQFEQKYDKLDTLFVNRHVMISTRRYYEEVNKETEELQREICEYKEQSDKRIKALNEQLDILKAMMPYQDMTMEQFCQHRPHLAPDFINKPTFWPHTPEEQMPGPSDPMALHPEEPEEPPKARPKPPASAATAAKPKEKPAESSASPKKEETSKAVEEMTEKGAEMVKELALKVQQLLTVAVAKISEVAKQVHDAAASTRATKAAEAAKTKAKEATAKPTEGSALTPKSKPKSEDEDDDHYHRREHSPNICTQTIIRGEESQTNTDVKAKHVNLSIESDDEDDDSLEEKRKRCNEMESKRNAKKKPEGNDCDDDDNDSPCKQQKKQKISECQSRDKQESPEKDCEKRRKCEAEESQSEWEKKSTEKKKEELQFEDAANGDFANSISTCVPVQKTKIIDKKGTRDPCKPQEKASLNQMPEGGSSSQGIGMMGPTGNDIFSSDQYPKEYKEGTEGATEGAFKQKRIWESDSQNLETGEDKVKESKAKARETDAAGDQKVEEDSPVNVYPRMEITAKAKKTKSEPPPVEVQKESADDLAKQVFDMATGAASMLNEATISVEEAQKLKSHRIETLEAAYRSAHKQANRALAEAFKAVEAANKLAKRSRRSSESQFRDHDAQAMAEKHALLAKMLVKRAVALKKEIAKVLEKLEHKE